MQTYQTPEEMREEYINTHQHGWTMHQEADWWLKKLQAREEWLRREILRLKDEVKDSYEFGAGQYTAFDDVLSLIKK